MSYEAFRVFLFVSSEKIRGAVAFMNPPLAFGASLEPFHLTLILLDSLCIGMTPWQSCHRCHAAIAFTLSDWPSCMFSPLPESDIDAATAMMLLNSAPGHHVDPCKRIYMQHMPHSSSLCATSTRHPVIALVVISFCVLYFVTWASLVFPVGVTWKTLKDYFGGEKSPRQFLAGTLTPIKYLPSKGK